MMKIYVKKLLPIKRHFFLGHGLQFLKTWHKRQERCPNIKNTILVELIARHKKYQTSKRKMVSL